jgi:hypothetical protein
MYDKLSPLACVRQVKFRLLQITDRLLALWLRASVAVAFLTAPEPVFLCVSGHPQYHTFYGGSTSGTLI